MTTTEDNKDQDAAEDTRAGVEAIVAGVVGAALISGENGFPFKTTQRILSALAEAGYTVVKTPSGYEYGFAFDSDSPETVNDYGVFPTAKAALESAAPRSLGERDTYRAYRRRIAPIIEPFRWEPVPESDTLGGGEQ